MKYNVVNKDTGAEIYDYDVFPPAFVCKCNKKDNAELITAILNNDNDISK